MSLCIVKGSVSFLVRTPFRLIQYLYLRGNRFLLVKEEFKALPKVSVFHD